MTHFCRLVLLFSRISDLLYFPSPQLLILPSLSLVYLSFNFPYPLPVLFTMSSSWQRTQSVQVQGHERGDNWTKRMSSFDLALYTSQCPVVELDWFPSNHNTKFQLKSAVSVERSRVSIKTNSNIQTHFDNVASGWSDTSGCKYESPHECEGSGLLKISAL